MAMEALARPANMARHLSDSERDHAMHAWNYTLLVLILIQIVGAGWVFNSSLSVSCTWKPPTGQNEPPETFNQPGKLMPGFVWARLSMPGGLCLHRARVSSLQTHRRGWRAGKPFVDHILFFSGFPLPSAPTIS
jgi:hypothetical protein